MWCDGGSVVSIVLMCVFSYVSILVRLLVVLVKYRLLVGSLVVCILNISCICVVIVCYISFCVLCVLSFGSCLVYIMLIWVGVSLVSVWVMFLVLKVICLLFSCSIGSFIVGLLLQLFILCELRLQMGWNVQLMFSFSVSMCGMWVKWELLWLIRQGVVVMGIFGVGSMSLFVLCGNVWQWQWCVVFLYCVDDVVVLFFFLFYWWFCIVGWLLVG